MAHHRAYLTYEDCIARYPRLIRAMQFVACLTKGEAGCAIRDYRAGSLYSGEAVNHFGGTSVVIARAIVQRHLVARYHAACE